MIVRFLLAALGAGLLAGLLVTPVQYARVIPLILHAETFEGQGGHHHGEAAAPHSHDAPAASHDHGTTGAAAAADPLEEEASTLTDSRLFNTVLANLVTGAGFALILAAASLILDLPITGRNGALWGLAGFFVLSLAPALSLAPELPAMPAGDLFARQMWWLATVVLAAGGVYALALRGEIWAKVLGIGALAAPHLLGAPQPAELASPVPPTLAAEFAVASLATAAAFWLILAVLSGYAFDRLREGRPAEHALA
jgi:cobalt transporter subunit CbtA